jgi:hypothetical protein
MVKYDTQENNRPRPDRGAHIVKTERTTIAVAKERFGGPFFYHTIAPLRGGQRYYSDILNLWKLRTQN